MNDFLKTVRNFALDQSKEFGNTPIDLHIELSCEVGKNLAEKLGADAEIVQAGTLLMDCALGQAIKEGKQKDHAQMSVDAANKFLSKSNLSENQKENIRYCILQHHGVEKFFSLESEICCNTDCYRFTSVKGFTLATRYLKDMPFEDLIVLLKTKFSEKSNAMSLDVCKKELTEEIATIQKLLEKL